MKLSKAQLEVLEQAASHLEHEHYLSAIGRGALEKASDPGWFYPQHHECCSVRARWQTCASLCGLGLLEYAVDGYFKERGKWRDYKRYRITEAGRKLIAEMEAANPPKKYGKPGLRGEG